MTNDSFNSTTELLPTPSRSPQQLIDGVIELLRQENALASDILELLCELGELLDRCFALRIADSAHEDAIERAPWLTADAERLKRQQAALRQSLRALCLLAGRGGASCEALAERFDEFTELYWQHEAAEQNFLEAAFPGPEWVEQG